jgi:hypothetical protein
MGVRVLVVTVALVLAGCSAGSDPAKAAICTKAIAVLVVAEASSDAQDRLREAQSASSELRKLSSQTSDTTLSSALRDAASTAGQATSDWSPSRLAAWVTAEQTRFDAVRSACA